MREKFEYRGHEIEVTDFGVFAVGMEFTTIDEAVEWIDSNAVDEPAPAAPVFVEEEYAVTYVPWRGKQSKTKYVIARNPAEAVRIVRGMIPSGSSILSVY